MDGRAEFEALLLDVVGYNFRFVASVTLFDGTVLTVESRPFNVLSLVYDFVEVVGCPTETETNGIVADSPMPTFTVLGVFQAFSADRKLRMRANTQGYQDSTGVTQGVFAHAKMCQVSQSTGDPICDYDMTPPMVLGGTRAEMFNADGQANFTAMRTPNRKNAASVLILEVTSPFDGTVIIYRCPPILIKENLPRLIQFLTEPHHSGDAGLVLTLQPILEALDMFENRVTFDPNTGSRISTYGSLCGACACPCTQELKHAGVGVFGPSPDAQWSVFSPKCTYCSSHESFLVDAVSTADERGRHKYPFIRIIKAGNWKLLFAWESHDYVYLASQIVKIKSCQLASLAPSQSTTFGAIQPGNIICNGGPCIFEARDAFGNFVSDVSMTLRASLGIVADAQLAAFTIPENCRCSGVNTFGALRRHATWVSTMAHRATLGKPFVV